MKKIISAVLSIFILTGCSGFVSCGNGGDNTKKTIVCTIFPEYDWVRNILGKKSNEYEVTLLGKNGVDLHSYQPSADDIVKIGQSDLFVYIGGESDEWVEKAFKSVKKDESKTLNLINALGELAKDEREEGGEEHSDHIHDENQDHDEHEKDEHIWLSLKNASVACDKIAEKLCELFPENKTDFENNLAKYKEKIDSLDNEFKEAIDKSSVKTLVFGDRFPFRYFADDYSLNCYAAFSGCSAETEASFETIVFLAGKIDEYNLSSICVIDGGDKGIAKSVINATKNKNQQIVVFDSMQAIKQKDIENGEDYLSLMRKNYKAVKTALGTNDAGGNIDG